MLNVTAAEAEKLSHRKKKKNPDQGFADYEQATVRQYNRLVKQIKPNMQEYEMQKEKLGGAFYGDRNTILHGLHKDSKDGIDRMVDDLEKQLVFSNFTNYVFEIFLSSDLIFNYLSQDCQTREIQSKESPQ